MVYTILDLCYLLCSNLPLLPLSRHLIPSISSQSQSVSASVLRAARLLRGTLWTHFRAITPSRLQTLLSVRLLYSYYLHYLTSRARSSRVPLYLLQLYISPTFAYYLHVHVHARPSLAFVRSHGSLVFLYSAATSRLPVTDVPCWFPTSVFSLYCTALVDNVPDVYSVYHPQHDFSKASRCFCYYMRLPDAFEMVSSRTDTQRAGIKSP